jgi:hypothetical protein
MSLDTAVTRRTLPEPCPKPGRSAGAGWNTRLDQVLAPSTCSGLSRVVGHPPPLSRDLRPQLGDLLPYPSVKITFIGVQGAWITMVQACGESACIRRRWGSI